MRIVLTEDRFYPKPITILAQDLGIDQYVLMVSLNAVDAYLSQRLSIGSSLRFEHDRFMFKRVAGIFPVTDQLEIEVIPKFMIGDELWRSDFLLLLARTRWGVIAEHQMIAASRSKERGINDSLALVFLTLFEKVSHIPIRTYSQRTVRSFEIEGDLEEESILLPDNDGFEQNVTEFTRHNDYNAVIASAAHVLAVSTKDFNLRARLERALQQLGPQDSVPMIVPHAVPSRFRNWTELYGLCIDILDGYGIDYLNQGEVMSPGFVVRTSDAWEEFIRQALVAGMTDCTVAFQEKHPFAKRDNSVVRVRPDYILRSKTGSSLLVDAKYKYSDAKKKTISNADIYEGWAFMEATSIQRLVLLYPYSAGNGKPTFEAFQHVWNSNKEIIGMRVNPAFEGSEGYRHFSKELAAAIRPLML